MSGKTVTVIKSDSGGKIYAYTGKFTPCEAGLTAGEIIEGWTIVKKADTPFTA